MKAFVGLGSNLGEREAMIRLQGSACTAVSTAVFVVGEQREPLRDDVIPRGSHFTRTSPL